MSPYRSPLTTDESVEELEYRSASARGGLLSARALALMLAVPLVVAGLAMLNGADVSRPALGGLGAAVFSPFIYGVFLRRNRDPEISCESKARR